MAQQADALEEEYTKQGKEPPPGLDVAIPYYKACVVMTRPDFLQDLDHDVCFFNGHGLPAKVRIEHQ